MIKKDRLCKLRKLIYRGFISIYKFRLEKNQSNAESCKVTTIANTNRFPQNLKKRYRLSLAIVVPQSERHLHSGDRLFEWPKLLKKNDK